MNVMSNAISLPLKKNRPLIPCTLAELEKKTEEWNNRPKLWEVKDSKVKVIISSVRLSKAKRHVESLKRWLFKASLNSNWRLVKKITVLLRNSYDNYLLSFHRITKSSGAKTAGVDGIKLNWNNEADHANTRKLVKAINRGKKYEPKPLRRVYIPKPDGTKRNLGIPTHFDRLYQAILTPAIETIVEMLVNKHKLNTFGFRPKIRAADAIGCLSSYAWKGSRATVLDMDIEKCFDQINHSYILKLTEEFGLSHYKQHINQMLQSGYIDIDGSLHDTDTGTPQGGVISPALANLVLRKTLDIPLATLHIKNTFNINCVSYADDAVIVLRPNGKNTTPEQLEKAMNTLKLTITENLLPAGLKIKESKTRVIMDSSPFNFLGFEIGRGRGIIPAKSKLKAAIHKINGMIRHGSQIKSINSVIRGFESYYSHFSSAKMWKQIGKLDWYVNRMIWKRRKKELHNLIKFSDIPKTTRYMPPKKGNSYLADPAFFTKRTWSDNPRKKTLYKKQAGICPICKCKMENEPSTLQVHHIHSKVHGGKDKNSNAQLIHESCHLSLHYHHQEDSV
jgi:RNA-directed DNA polymerase